MQCVAVCCNALQCVAVHCSVLQCVAAGSAKPRKTQIACVSTAAVCSKCVLQCVFQDVLQCIAVCCSVMQCDTACFSVLQPDM